MSFFRFLFLSILPPFFSFCYSGDSWINSFFEKAVVATSISGDLSGFLPPSNLPKALPEIVIEANSIELVSGYTVSIPSVDLNQIGDNFPITIRNIGTAPLPLAYVAVGPGSYGDWTQFKIDSNSLPQELAPNQTGVFYVSFQPIVQDSASVSLYIVNGDSDEGTFKVNVVSSAAPTSEISISQGNTSIENGGSINLGGEGSCPEVTTYSFSIVNLGLKTLNLTGNPKVIISGTDASLFTVIASPSVSSLTRYQSISFSIRFSPTGALGERSATVTIPNDDPDESEFSFDFKTSKGIPEIYLYHGLFGQASELLIGSLLDAGYTYVRSTVPSKSFGIGINNVGDETLFLTGKPTIEATGDGVSSFSFNNPISTILRGSGQWFSVNVLAKNPGMNLANFSIPNNDCDESPYTFQLTTRGYDSGIVTGNPSWASRRGHTSVAFADKIWILGGAYRTSFYQDVYSSTNGLDWELKTANAPWGKRAYHASVVFNNKIWVLGGNENNTRRNDVWSSPDGVNWTREVESAPWTGRFEFSAVVFDNKIWVIAGKKYTNEALRDVWYSSDGVNWTLATDNPVWSARSTFSLLAFQNKLWIIGGFAPASQILFKDVWNSADGVIWTKVTDTPEWIARSAMAGVVYNNAMYILSGFDGHNVLSDSYRSEDGQHWSKFDSPWGARDTHSAVPWKNKIWVMGGQNQPGYPYQDVYTFWDY